MNKNEFEITILEDGTVKIETDSFEGATHLAAEKTMMWFMQQLGGEAHRVRKPHVHAHNHDHSRIKK